MAAELVLALLLSVLGVFTLPRRSVRARYAALDAKGRAQFWLFSGGSLLFAISLWFDIASRLRNQGNGSFTAIAVGAGLWILLLAGTEIPDLWNGRSVTLQRVPAGFPGGRALYRGVLRGIPTIEVALLVFTLGVFANILAANGVVDGAVFRTLLVVSLVAIVLGLCAVVFGKPAFLVPPPLRGEPGLIPSLSKERRSGRRS